MASLKDSRSMGLTASNPRQSRHHSYSISLGAVNVNHRVTRRKSINAANTTTVATAAAATAAAAVAAAAALNETGQPGTSPAASHRRGLNARRGAESTSVGASSTFGSYMARNAAERKHSPNTAVDGVSTSTKPVSIRHRSRRASEGSHLVRGEGRRFTTELKCDRCGKGYKHSSCLTKHMWEHDPAWAITSKLLISKHQQVQLLEAASVLVNMKPDTENSLAASEAPRTGDSDRSSTSPTVSGISELRSGLSSTETTPPPIGDDMAFSAKSAQQYNSSAFSRSFQSIPSSSLSSMPSYSPVHGHFRQSSVDTRPSTADTGILDDDAAGLAAAVELCNFGTPRQIPGTASDVPPVPPLPAQYLGKSATGSSVPTGNNGARASLGTAAPHSFNSSVSRTNPSTSTLYDPLPLHAPLSYRISDERDVRMDDIKEVERDDDDSDRRSSAMQMDDDDDGVFGRMEE